MLGLPRKSHDIILIMQRGFFFILILGLTKMYKWYNNNRLFPDISMFHGFSPWDGAASPWKIFFEWSPLPQLPATPGIPQTLRDWLFNAPLWPTLWPEVYANPMPPQHNLQYYLTSFFLFPFCSWTMPTSPSLTSWITFFWEVKQMSPRNWTSSRCWQGTIPVC